jgi:hypothetical protein
MTFDFESSAASDSSGIYRIGRFCQQRKLAMHADLLGREVVERLVG